MSDISISNSKKTSRNYVILTITIFAGFLIFGFSENIKGPAIPIMQADFRMSELQVGLLLAVNSLGYLVACFYTASLSRKIGLKATLILCLIGMALSGISICFSPNYTTLALSYFVMYLGNGMLEIALGIMAATIFTKNTGTMMNLSHFFYGLSSTLAPILSAGLIRARIGAQVLGWRYMYLIILAWSVIPIIPALLGKMNRQVQDDKPKGYKAFLKNANAWLIITILSFAVTCEMGAGGWLANYMEKAYRFDTAKAALILTAFFICFTLARLLLGPLTDKIGFVKSLLIFTAFSGISIIIGVICGKPGIIFLIIAGFGIAPVYPTVMALLAKLFTDNIESAMTVTLTIMGISIVLSNLMLGGLVEFFRRIFTSYMGEPGIGPAYAAGYMLIGIFCLASCTAVLVLYKKLKRTNQMV